MTFISTLPASSAVGGPVFGSGTQTSSGAALSAAASNVAARVLLPNAVPANSVVPGYGTETPQPPKQPVRNYLPLSNASRFTAQMLGQQALSTLTAAPPLTQAAANDTAANEQIRAAILSAREETALPVTAKFSGATTTASVTLAQTPTTMAAALNASVLSASRQAGPALTSTPTAETRTLQAAAPYNKRTNLTLARGAAAYQLAETRNNIPQTAYAIEAIL